jgi:DNA-damage-inducible protein D
MKDKSSKRKDIEKSADKLVVFEDKKIRRIFHEGEWYFSIIDIIEVLTGSSHPQ